MEKSKIRRINIAANLSIAVTTIGAAYALYMLVTEQVDQFKALVGIHILIFWGIFTTILRDIRLIKMKLGEKK